MRSRIGVGILALSVVSSCGGRVLGPDAGDGVIDAGAAGNAGLAGRGIGGSGPGGSATGGDSGAIGSGGASGRGGIGGTGGGFGGSTGRGGFGGTTGIAGSSGTGGIAGRGGAGGTGGIGGTTGRGGGGGTGGTGGSGGTGGIAGTGGIGGIGGRGGFGAAGGTGGSGAFGGEFGTAGRGGFVGTGGSGGIAGTGGIGGSGGTGGIGGIGGRGGGGNAGTGGAGGAVCLTCRSTMLPIPGRHVVYNAARNELYVSVAGDADAYPNTIVIVDPSSSSVVSTIPVGSNPDALALSDDGSTLWVGIDGAHAIRKVTMTSTPPTVGPLTRLIGSNPPSYFDAGSIAVLRGSTLSVAVAFSVGQYQYYASDVRVYDDGVPRPIDVGGLTASSVTAGRPGYLFGTLASPGYFFVYTVSASGITQTINYNLFRNFSTNTTNLVFSADRVYSGSGDVIDVTNPAAPTWAGSVGRTGPVGMRDPQSLLMLTNGQNTFPFTPRADVRVISAGSLSEVADVQLRNSVAATGTTTYRDLVYAGGDAVAFLRSDAVGYTTVSGLGIVHDPAFGMPTGGSGGTTGTGGVAGAGGTGGAAGMGGTGGAPDPCPGCTFATAQAYGVRFANDASRNLLYVSAPFQAALHPSTIVTVDATTAAVTSFVPVGNDPQPVALSDDGSTLWVGLAGDHRVRRMTPGTTPVPGPAYALPTLLTTGEQAVPGWIAVLPGTTSSIAVAVYGTSLGGQGVFILDDGQPRANYIQPPEIAASFVINGPPGYLLGIGASNNLVVYRIGTVGATLESYGGLVSSYAIGLEYSAGFAYASDGAVIDLSNPDAPQPAGRFAYSNCLVAVRSPSRAFMLCPNPTGRGPILRVLDTGNFVQVGAVTLPDSLGSQTWSQFAYIGGDALALLAYNFPLQIMHAPIIASPP